MRSSVDPGVFVPRRRIGDRPAVYPVALRAGTVYTHTTRVVPHQSGETTVSAPPRTLPPAGPPAYACRLRASVQGEYIERVPVSFLSLPLSLFLSFARSPSFSLSFLLGMGTGPYVLWIRTRRFPPFPHAPRSLGSRMTQPSASHPAASPCLACDATQSGVHSNSGSIPVNVNRRICPLVARTYVRKCRALRTCA